MAAWSSVTFSYTLLSRSPNGGGVVGSFVWVKVNGEWKIALIRRVGG